MNQMTHLNKNMLCVIDVETTGLESKTHEIIEICILPLNSFIKPEMNECPPFHMFIKPEHPELASPQALKVNKVKLSDLMLRGVDKYKAADAFDEWFANLDCKKIVPLAQNWPFDRSFIIEWIGALTFNHIFDYHPRDTAVVANYLNDRADQRSEKCPFPRISLGYLCSQLDVQNPDAHTALGDCIATAEVYRKMLQSGSLL